MQQHPKMKKRIFEPREVTTHKPGCHALRFLRRLYWIAILTSRPSLCGCHSLVPIPLNTETCNRGSAGHFTLVLRCKRTSTVTFWHIFGFFLGWFWPLSHLCPLHLSAFRRESFFLPALLNTHVSLRGKQYYPLMYLFK